MGSEGQSNLHAFMKYAAQMILHKQDLVPTSAESLPICGSKTLFSLHVQNRCWEAGVKSAPSWIPCCVKQRLALYLASGGSSISAI